MLMLLPFRRYVDFSGRSRRSEFWLFVLLQVIVWSALVVLMIVSGGAMLLSAGDATQLAGAGGAFAFILLIAVVYWLATLLPLYAVSVRRLHDTNRSGWWVFAPLLLSIVTNVLTLGAAGAGEIGAATALVLLLSTASFVLNIVVLVFFCLDGTRGPNQYGHDPKHRGYEHTFA